LVECAVLREPDSADRAVEPLRVHRIQTSLAAQQRPDQLSLTALDARRGEHEPPIFEREFELVGHVLACARLSMPMIEQRRVRWLHPRGIERTSHVPGGWRSLAGANVMAAGNRQEEHVT
jgi:hypothetical protein